MSNADTSADDWSDGGAFLLDLGKATDTWRVFSRAESAITFSLDGLVFTQLLKAFNYLLFVGVSGVPLQFLIDGQANENS